MRPSKTSVRVASLPPMAVWGAIVVIEAVVSACCASARVANSDSPPPKRPAT
ncbi:MAG: hypothetical protein HC855_06080 [Rhizobiales bacterium]|nr:hypothetical protein [Hyphomicrobiales bacterium]